MKPVSTTEAGCQTYASGRSFRGPERLVGLGFRHWLDGLRTSDIASWERAWNAYAGAMDLPAAKTAVGLLSRWVCLVAVSARRDRYRAGQLSALQSRRAGGHCHDRRLPAP
jgi:hypothetical protein